MESANLKFTESEEDIKYVECATRYDIVKHVCNSLIDNGWNTTYEYLKYQPKTFVSKRLAAPSGTQREFIKYVDYCYLLSKNLTEKDAAAVYESRQGKSIYFSVVLYWLLSYFGVVNEKKLNYCQGYFRYKIRNDLRPRPRYRAGMHAWLCYNESVIDVTIWQQEDYFDFNSAGFNVPAILGEIPEGMGLVGFEEDRSLVKNYGRTFAKDSEMTFCEWLHYHKEQADLLFETRTTTQASPLNKKENRKYKSL